MRRLRATTGDSVMSFELREWRALAIGWAAAVAYAIGFGVDFGVATTATGSTLIVWAVWPD